LRHPFKLRQRHGAIEANDLRVGNDLTPPVGVARNDRQVAMLQRDEMPVRDLRFLSNLLQRQAATLTGATEELSKSSRLVEAD
jgi:hypothetical protein